MFNPITKNILLSWYHYYQNILALEQFHQTNIQQLSYLRLYQGPFNFTKHVRSPKIWSIILQCDVNLVSFQLAQFFQIEGKTSNIILQ